MSSVKNVDVAKLRAVRIVVTAAITATIAFLLLSLVLSGYWLTSRSAPIGAALSAMTHSYQASGEQVPPDRASREPAAPYQSPVASIKDQMSASGMPRPGTSPAPQPGAAVVSEKDPVASEQRSFQSRKALETIDPREFLRQGK